jgi:hypothetical protein
MAKKKNPMTNYEAVRRALDKLGMDAETQTALNYIKKEFGVEIEAQPFWNARSKLRAEQRPAAKPRMVAKPKGKTGATAPSNGFVALEDVKAVMALAARIGTEKVREILDVVG